MNNFLSYWILAKFYGNYDRREKSSKDLRNICSEGPKNRKEMYQFVGLENNEEGQSL